MIFESLLSLIASFGFGMIFNIKGKKLIFAAFGGGLSWFTYLLMLKFGFSNILALFISSLTISIYSEIFARVLKTPVTTLVISSLIPLVPGSGMYYTIYKAIIGDLHDSLNTGLQTLAYAGTLAIGIIFVSTITKQINILKQKDYPKR